MVQITNRLREARQQSGLSQTELAQRAAVTRQTVSGLESGGGTPTLAVALRLAQVLGCGVDDLFWLPPPAPTVEAEVLPAAATLPPTRRVQVARVGERTLARLVDAFAVADGLLPDPLVGPAASTVTLLTPPRTVAHTAVVLGCDPALATLGSYLARQHASSGMRLLIGQASSLQALAALQRGETHAAGMHLRDPDTGEYNLPYIRRALAGQRVRVVTAAHWQQGLMLAAGNPLGIQTVADLARPEVSLVNRELGAGSRAALDAALTTAGLTGAQVRGYDRIVGSHHTVAAIVAAGFASAGPGILAAASAQGLAFLPLAEERYDLVFTGATAESDPVMALLETLISPAFRSELGSLPGYDASRTGTIVLDETLPAVAADAR